MWLKVICPRISFLSRCFRPIQLVTRHLSSSEDVNTAKLLVDYLSKMPESSTAKSKDFKLKDIHNQLASLTEEFTELEAMTSLSSSAAASKEDQELAQVAAQDSENITDEIRSLLVLSSRLILSSRQFDSQDAILEVTAGAGGLEAGVFASEILNLYLGYVGSLGFEASVLEHEDLTMSTTSKGSSLSGISSAKVLIQGHQDVFLSFKYECGVHRVQRVPVTGSRSDRLQTSTCSVAVYPQPKDENVYLDPKDLKFEYMRSSGKGGQNVNKTDSACRLTHLPSGVAVKCQEERFQQKNKARAIQMVKGILYNQQFEAEMSQMAKYRKSQIGNMNRNEKIRSYNFNRNTITDHRLGESKIFPDIEQFLRGSFGYGMIAEMRDKLDTIDGIESLKDFIQQKIK